MPKLPIRAKPVSGHIENIESSPEVDAETHELRRYCPYK